MESLVGYGEGLLRREAATRDGGPQLNLERSLIALEASWAADREMPDSLNVSCPSTRTRSSRPFFSNSQA